MTLRDIGQFLLEVSEEFLKVFLWNTNWLDANVLVLILVCIAYLLLTILAIGFLTAISDEFGGLSGLIRQLLRWFFGFWIFSFIIMIPVWLQILLDIEELSTIQVVLGYIWIAFVIYGFWWHEWGTRILDYLGAKLFGSKEIDANSSD